MNKLVVLTVVIFAVAAGVALAFDDLFSKADYEALCRLEHECRGTPVEDCRFKYEELRAEQGPCKKFQDRIAACKLEPGGARCESSGSLRMLMAREPCKPAIDELFECLREHDDGRPKPQPQPVP